MNSYRIRVKVKTLVAAVALILVLGLSWFAYTQLPSYLYYNGYNQQVMNWFPGNEYAKMAKGREMYGFAYKYYHDYDYEEDNHIFMGADGSSGPFSMIGEDQVLGRLDEGIPIMEGYLSEHPKLEQSGGFLHVLAKLHVRAENWDRAEELFRQELELSSEPGSNAMEAESWLKILASRKERTGITPSIAGSVLLGGQAAPNAYVVLQAADDNGWMSPPYTHYPITITDDQGRYRFYNVEPGEYKLWVGVLNARVENFVLSDPQEKTVTVNSSANTAAVFDFQFLPRVVTIAPADKETIAYDEALHFQWEPYEGAAFYRVYLTTLIRDADGKITGQHGRPLPGDIHGTEAVYTLERLREEPVGRAISYDSDGNISYSPDYLLGMAYPGGEFMWSVDAFDERGLKLSSSGGTFLGGDRRPPLFRLSDEGMQEGDRLVIAGKYKEAIQAYEREGDDPHALRVLARITEEGTKKGEADPGKALTYLERIQEPNAEDLSEMERLREKMASGTATNGSGIRESEEHALKLLNEYHKEKQE